MVVDDTFDLIQLENTDFMTKEDETGLILEDGVPEFGTGNDELLLESGDHMLLDETGLGTFTVILEQNTFFPGGTQEGTTGTKSKSVGVRLKDVYEDETGKSRLIPNVAFELMAKLETPLDSPFRLRARMKKELKGKIRAKTKNFKINQQSPNLTARMTSGLYERFDLISKLKKNQRPVVKVEAKLDFIKLLAKIEKWLRLDDPKGEW